MSENFDDLVVFNGGYQGTTNIRELKMLYSIKRNKFISPFKTNGDRVVGDILYHVFPGTYVVFDLWVHRGARLTISLVKLSKTVSADTADTVEVLKRVIINFVNDSYLDNSVIAYDFVRAVPGYHFTRHEGLFKKLYTYQDTQVLLEFLDKYNGKEFAEGAETE